MSKEYLTAYGEYLTEKKEGKRKRKAWGRYIGVLQDSKRKQLAYHGRVSSKGEGKTSDCRTPPQWNAPPAKKDLVPTSLVRTGLRLENLGLRLFPS